MESPTAITIGTLYPELNEQQLKEAEENLEGYLTVVIRIYQRISADPKALAELRAELSKNSLVKAS